MKKLLKNNYSKIITVLLIIMLLLSTVAIYKIYAAITNESVSEGKSENKVQSGKYISYQDLQKMYDILCCYNRKINTT